MAFRSTFTMQHSHNIYGHLEAYQGIEHRSSCIPQHRSSATCFAFPQSQPRSFIRPCWLLVPWSATCYWQNSSLAPDSPWSIATDDTACFPDQINSPCCGTGWSCLSDGVCYIKQAGRSIYYRGTYTPDFPAGRARELTPWQAHVQTGHGTRNNAPDGALLSVSPSVILLLFLSSLILRISTSQRADYPSPRTDSNTSIPLAKCSEPGSQDWYCCGGDPDCSCESGYNAIKLGASQPTIVTVIGSTSWPGYVSTSLGRSTSALVSDGTTTSVTPARTIEVSSLGTSSNGDSATVASPDLTEVVGSAASSSSTLPQASSSSQSNTGLAAGLGAGLGVATIAIAAFAFIYFRSRRRRATGLARPTNFRLKSRNGSELPAAPEYTINEMAGN